jgi:hypothetical protein
MPTARTLVVSRTKHIILLVLEDTQHKYLISQWEETGISVTHNMVDGAETNLTQQHSGWSIRNLSTSNSSQKFKTYSKIVDKHD